VIRGIKEWMVGLWESDNADAPFQVGDKVTYIGNVFSQYHGMEFTVVGYNATEDDIWEYAIDWPLHYLVWDFELVKGE
jgi:hypothetical protein